VTAFCRFYQLLEDSIMATSATRIDIADDAIDEITPHQVITLLLDGAMERIDKAIARLNEGDVDQAADLVQKTIAIVASLRESLNLDAGGDIAANLDALYEYIVTRLDAISGDAEPIAILSEVSQLLSEVHAGWSGIASKV
jgi:flagellar protein FliS